MKPKEVTVSIVTLILCSLFLTSCSNAVDEAKVKELEEKIQKLEDDAKKSIAEGVTNESKVESNLKLSVVIKQGGSTINYYYDPETYPTEKSVRAEGCYDFDGISNGGSLKVSNANGKIIGLSKFSLRIYRIDPPDEIFTDWTVFCEAFTTIALPKSDIYQLKVGLRSAGEFSFSELNAKNWELNLVS